MNVGIDMLEISRIKKAIEKPTFYNKCFSKLEQDEFIKYKKYWYIAASFATKEAFAKSLGIGINEFTLTEISLLHNSNGNPFLYFEGDLKKYIEQKQKSFEISITHTDMYVIAIVVMFD